jgi:pimeloyl-ACP methyl ester carboxylesterase
MKYPCRQIANAAIHCLQSKFCSCIRGLLLPLLLVFFIGEAISHPIGNDDMPSSSYAHPQTLVDVESGRRLNLFCLGHGFPTVIYEAGGGEDSVSFRRVQRPLSAITRVCSYDRAGLGFSDAAVRASNAENIVADLHRLIEKAGLGTPIILLGHSSGGLYASLFAANYPDEVAAMVLIDPSFAGQNNAITAGWTPQQKKAWRDEDRADIRQLMQCVALAKKGALSEQALRKSPCLDNPPDADPLLHNVMNHQLALPRVQSALLSETRDTIPGSSSIDGVSAAEKALRDSRFQFGDKPLIVLTAADSHADQPGDQRDRARQAWRHGHDVLAARSSIGRNIVVQNSSHFIMLDQPDVVVRYATEVINAVRTAKPMTSTP